MYSKVHPVLSKYPFRANNHFDNSFVMQINDLVDLHMRIIDMYAIKTISLCKYITTNKRCI